MTTEHTPGPWVATQYSDGSPLTVVYAANGREVADVRSEIKGGVAEDEANAALIAASPDLLAACIDMLFMHSIVDENTICDCKACTAARAAIAKARGTEPDHDPPRGAK